MEFLFENKASLLFLVGVVVLIVTLMRRWSRHYKRQRAATKRDARRPALGAPNVEQPLMDAPPEILRWHVEMHEVARDLKAELDTKIAVLERLTIDARQQAERLEKIVQQAEQTALSDSPASLRAD